MTLFHLLSDEQSIQTAQERFSLLFRDCIPVLEPDTARYAVAEPGIASGLNACPCDVEGAFLVILRQSLTSLSSPVSLVTLIVDRHGQHVFLQNAC